MQPILHKNSIFWNYVDIIYYHSAKFRYGMSTLLTLKTALVWSKTMNRRVHCIYSVLQLRVKYYLPVPPACSFWPCNCFCATYLNKYRLSFLKSNLNVLLKIVLITVLDLNMLWYRFDWLYSCHMSSTF